MADDKMEFGGMFGLGGMSRDQYFRMREQKRREEVTDPLMKSYSDANQIGGRTAAAAAGLAQSVMNKFRPQEMDPEVEKRFKASEELQRSMETVDRDMWKEMTAEQKEEFYLKQAAEAAFRNGLPEIGTQAYAKYQERRYMREKRTEELKKLGIENDTAAMENEATRAELDMVPEAQARKRREWNDKEFAELWSMDGKPLGPWRLNKDWEAVDKDGNVVYRAGEFTAVPPKEAFGSSGAGGGVGTRKLSPAAEREAVGMQTGVQDVIFAGNALMDIIEKYEAKGPNGQVLGWGGDIARLSTQLVDNLQGAANAMATALGKDPDWEGVKTADGKEISLSNPKKMIKHYERQLDAALAPLNEQFRQQGVDATQARVLILGLANAIMRANEPGAGRYSDDDFKRALAEAGDGLADPNKLRATLWAKLSQADNRYRNFRKAYGDDRIAMAVDPDSYEGYLREFDTFRTRILGNRQQPAAPQGAAPAATEGQWSVRRQGRK